jgi:drug/metabolite transporter (DMT)-like permease
MMSPKSGTPAYVYVFALLAMIFWGVSLIWTSIVFEYYDPITTIFLRLVISSAFLFIILIFSGFIQKIRKKHFLLFLASAIFNPFFYFLGENFGLKYTSASVSAVIIATIPLFTPFAAWWMIKERLSAMNIAGIIISFLGILIMLIKPDLSFSAKPAGIALLLFAVASAVIYSVLLKKLTLFYSPINIIAWQNLIGVFLFLPFFLILDLKGFLSVAVDTRLLSALFSLAIFASSMAYVLFAVTLKHIGVSRTNVYSNLIPVITAVGSYYILDEVFNTGKTVGIIIVISGVILTQVNKVKKKHE